MQLAEQHIIRRDDKRFAALDQACFYAKNIYNAANYELRQTLFAERRRLSYTEQEKHFKQKDLLPDQQLPMKVVQHVLKGLHHDGTALPPHKPRTRYALRSSKPVRSCHTTKTRAGAAQPSSSLSRPSARKHYGKEPLYFQD